MYSRWLAVTALSYAVVHHLGLLPEGLGDGPDQTRWADWIDLLVPWAVLVPAAFTMRDAPATQRAWLWFGAGSVLYLTGHGIHLAANSIYNAHPSDTAHLWDEVVGHAIWYAGAALILAALALTMLGRPRPAPVGYLLAIAAGLTWATNMLGGGPIVLGLVVAVAACAFGWMRRAELGVVLLVGFAPAVPVVLLGVYAG
ncbi:hypothetical protein [Nocardioides caricicola]|uniref:Sensor histidine kinase n=1 Tax=Nocardioides caricicola TaxID=634770 RepID=A0ABW0N129_9ACTN